MSKKVTVIQVFKKGESSAEVSDILVKKWVEDGLFYVTTKDDEGCEHTHGFPLVNLDFVRIFEEDDE